MPLPDHGLHDNIPEAAYHADQLSLSSTGAKKIITDGPAAYRWERDHPVHKDAFDLGSVVHALVLGVGDYIELDYDSWRSKEAKEARVAARADGCTPLLAKDMVQAKEIARAVQANTIARNILAEGRPEVSLWHKDEPTGVLMRGRIDWLRDSTIVDLKTSGKPVHLDEFKWTLSNYRYDFQARWYQRMVEHLTGDRLPYLWIVASTTGPYEVNVYQADQADLDACDTDIDNALATYAECKRTGQWPGLTPADEIHLISNPRRNR